MSDVDRQKTFEKIFKEHLKVETYSKSIDSLYSPRSINKIDYAPYYQRNYVWDNNKATYFIESILLGTEVPPLIFFDNNHNIEVIDGRQRFETILRFTQNKFSLTGRGLDALKQLAKTNWENLAKNEPEIIESFFDSKLRIIEFKLVNEPPLDKFLEDQVKKEIFSRYNSGITPLRKAEIDNAIYDDDDLTNSFKRYLEERPEVSLMVYRTFFKQLKKHAGAPPIENILAFVRRFLVLPSFPIKYFAKGTGRTNILAKLYEYYSDKNAENQDEIIQAFEKKVRFFHSVKTYSEKNDLAINRLALECFLWGLGVLDLEEVDYDLDDDFAEAISMYIHDNIGGYAEQDFAFSKEVLTRYSTTIQFFAQRFDTDFDVYLTADEDAKRRINEAKKPDDTFTRLSELESLRLNKPEPSRNSIDDVSRLLNRRRFLVRPSYQRTEVINPRKASSIIESILLGITLPAIFLFKRTDGVYEVIDGQQRLLTILGFTGSEYINEKGKPTYSKNHKFTLRGLRILNELNGKGFDDLSEDLKNKIFDFQLYLVEIDENQNPNFDPVDLFIRLNDKPFPIREHSFEMWNSWADIEIVEHIKALKKKLNTWLYVKQIKKQSDRDRMENEELLLSLAYLDFVHNSSGDAKYLDVYQKTDRLNARIRNKARISTVMQTVVESEDEKKSFAKSLKNLSTFIRKLKYVLLDKDMEAGLLDEYLKSQLDLIIKAGREGRFFRRTTQDFYFLWLFLNEINFEMVKYHRLAMKKEISDAFMYLKNIPESDSTDNEGLEKFSELLESFKNKYAKDSRTLKLSESEKLALIQSQRNQSSLSNAPIFLGDDLEVDHIVPLAIGGEDKVDNLGIAHSVENRSKGAKAP
ncbi:MAG: DUF262 domain-containing protein [Flavobacteriales bacterium]|nr:DUF262 domain-containing protein [Flavobacteriales bacterium]